MTYAKEPQTNRVAKRENHADESALIGRLLRSLDKHPEARDAILEQMEESAKESER